MKRRLLLYLIVTALCLFTPYRLMAESSVYITSEPGGASVTWDDSSIGRTPLEVKVERTGTYRMEIRLNGYNTETRNVEVRADGLDYPVHVRLSPTQPQVITTPVRPLFRFLAPPIPIYAIGLGNKLNVELLTRCANESGGSYFPAATADELLSIYRQIAGRLQNQYRVDYRTETTLGDSWHTLRITAKYGGQEVSVYRPFLANPDPRPRGIDPIRSLIRNKWTPPITGVALGLLLALALAAIFRVREIGSVIHRLIIVCAGLVLGFGIGVLYGFLT